MATPAERRLEVLASQIAGEEQAGDQQQQLAREETRATTGNEAHVEAMGEDAFAYAVPLPEKLTPDGRWEVYR